MHISKSSNLQPQQTKPPAQPLNANELANAVDGIRDQMEGSGLSDVLLARLRRGEFNFLTTRCGGLGRFFVLFCLFFSFLPLDLLPGEAPQS